MLALMIATSLTLAASTVHCEPVKGDLALVYDSWTKSGGAMPGPGTPMGEETWKLGEELLGSRLRPYLQDPVHTGIYWSWEEQSIRRKRHERSKYQEVTDYTVTAIITTASTRLIHALIPHESLTIEMRCHSVQVWGIP